MHTGGTSFAEIGSPAIRRFDTAFSGTFLEDVNRDKFGLLCTRGGGTPVGVELVGVCTLEGIFTRPGFCMQLTAGGGHRDCTRGCATVAGVMLV